MSSAARFANIDRSPGGPTAVWLLPVGAVALALATLTAMAETTHLDSVTERLARFNFTGTYRFKPHQPMAPPSHFQNSQQIVVASTAARYRPAIAPRDEYRRPLKVIASADQTPAPRVKKLAPATQRAEILVSKVPTVGTNPEPRSRKPRTASKPFAVERTLPVRETTLAEQPDGSRHPATPDNRSKQPGPTPAQRGPSDKTSQDKAPLGDVSGSPLRKAELQQPPSGALTAETKPSIQATVLSALSHKALSHRALNVTKPSSLGAKDLAEKHRPTPTSGAASKLPVEAKGKSASAATAALARTPGDEQEAQTKLQVSAATKQALPSETAPKMPVTRSALGADTPPLPAKYLRPSRPQTKSVERKKRTATKKRKVVRAAVGKPKRKPKPQPSSNWLSSAPRWANGAFKSE